MAAACAICTKADALVFLTDVPGVKGADGNVMRWLTLTQIPALEAARSSPAACCPNSTPAATPSPTASSAYASFPRRPPPAARSCLHPRQRWNGGHGRMNLRNDPGSRDTSCSSTPTSAIPCSSSAAKASTCSDDDGNDYLDLLSGIGVSALGYATPPSTRPSPPSRSSSSTPPTSSSTSTPPNSPSA